MKFEGYLKRQEIQRLMWDCDVFLFPSTLEACPFTLLEALRAGCAIVTTTAKPMPEFAGEAALYVEPQDIVEFGNKAYQIATDPGLSGILRARARERARQFTWEKNVSGLMATFSKAACAF